MKAVKKKVTKRGPGRPPFKITNELREKVERLTAVHMTQAQIAMAIGCDIKTLRLHFKDELTHGKTRVKAWLINQIWDSAKKGNVEAQILALDMAFKKPVDVSIGPARRPPVGKKVQQQVDADRISKLDPLYASPSPPKPNLKLIKSDDE